MNHRSKISLPGAVLVLRVELKTLTPNFKRFEIRTDGGDWRPSQASLRSGVLPGTNRIEAGTLNQPVDANAPVIKRALVALLWEEIRPIQRVELIWTANDQPRPSSAEISITALDHQGTASSWWNNLAPVLKNVEPSVSADGRTYAYDQQMESCGLVIGVDGGRTAAEYAVPSVRVLVAETWKQMEFGIEWG